MGLTALASVSSPIASGDLLYFKAGGRIQAPATIEEGHVRVQTPVGTYQFLETDFSKIVAGHDPEREWPNRRQAALVGDAGARLSAAWWALENGLIPECVAMLREARRITPSDIEAARLGGLVDRLDRPCPDRDTRSLRSALVVACREARSAHVLLLHQHDPTEAKSRIDVLENVVIAFYLWFGFHGVELPTPGEKLLAVYLRDREPYAAFLETQNARAFRSTFGYYHPTYQAVVAYDLRPSPSSARSVQQRPTEGDSGRLRLLRECEVRAFDIGTAAHEMIHLAVSVSGLDRDPRRLPLWFHEGLATQFEVVRGGRWAGISRAHDLRLPDWRAIPTPPPLIPLLRDVGFGRGYDRGLYAESWALVDFLRKTRPKAVLNFIDMLRNPDNREVGNVDRAVDRFRQAFGDDLPSLEAEWHRFTTALKTPLDEHDPQAR